MACGTRLAGFRSAAARNFGNWRVVGDDVSKAALTGAGTTAVPAISRLSSQRMRTDKRRPCRNGTLRCRLLNYPGPVALNRQAIAVAQRQVEAVRRKFDARRPTSVDVSRWQAELAQEQAVTEQLDGSWRIRHRPLAKLMGVSEAPALNLHATASTPQPPATLLPGELLERHPDVARQARALDDAAPARVPRPYCWW